jgi:signal transduction histidine kinase
MHQPLFPENLDSNKLKESARPGAEFLAIISHELRAPIHAILGWVELLDYTKFDPVAFAKALEVIKRNARLQARLVDELVDYSRVGLNRLPLKICIIPLAPIIKETVEALAPMAEEKVIHVEMRLDSSVDEIEGDPVRLQQVFLNLLSNAIKFTPDGGNVNVKHETSDHYHIITVSDTGEGISAEFLPFVFDRYRQADRIAASRGGLGLGLAIAQHIVELHGGIITADSRGKGEGAVFAVRLPCSQSRQSDLTTDA